MANQTEREQIRQDAAAAWEMKEEEIYRTLGLARLGTGTLAEARNSMKFVMSVAASANVSEATASAAGTLEEEGRSYFEELWNSVKAIICQVHSEKLPVAGKDLVSTLAAVIVAAGAITNALAVLVITIAVKRGLDFMCGIPD